MRIIAAIDDSATAAAVLDTSVVLAKLTGCDVEALYASDASRPQGGRRARESAATRGLRLQARRGDPVGVIVAALDAGDVLLGVVGARGRESGRRPAGHTALAVASAAPAPVVVAPPEARTVEIRRLLVPLEGVPTASRAVAETAHLLEHFGVEVIPLHVFGPENVPRFWDHPPHAAEAWSDEFLFRYCSVPSSALRIRAGDVGEAVMEVAADDDVDLIALAWSQDLSSDRAGVVRTVLSRSQVPVVLVPLAPART